MWLKGALHGCGPDLDQLVEQNVWVSWVSPLPDLFRAEGGAFLPTLPAKCIEAMLCVVPTLQTNEDGSLLFFARNPS